MNVLLTPIAIVAAALARWLGETEGQAVGTLVTAIRFAQIQIETARNMIAAITPETPKADADRVISVARDLVASSKRNVIVAAAHSVTIVPEAVLKAFEDFDATAVSVARSLAQEAEKVALVWVLAALAVLYLLSRNDGQAARRVARWA
jgi:hypothetical protein